MSRWASQTCASSSVLDTTSPERRRRYSSSENSRAVSSTSTSAAGHPPRRRVERQVAGPQHDRPLRGAAAQQRPQPGDEHDERERLGEVVVGADVERVGLVVLAVLGGEHQHRHPAALGAQRLHDPVARLPGQHDVEHDRVVVAGARPGQAVQAVLAEVDGEALRAQPALQGRRERPLVLDHQDAHAGSMPEPAARRPPVPQAPLRDRVAHWSGAPRPERGDRRGLHRPVPPPAPRRPRPRRRRRRRRRHRAPPGRRRRRSRRAAAAHRRRAARGRVDRRRRRACPAPSSRPAASACPSCRRPATGGSAVSLTGLLSGSTTARVWKAGDDRARGSPSTRPSPSTTSCATAARSGPTTAPPRTSPTCVLPEGAEQARGARAVGAAATPQDARRAAAVVRRADHDRDRRPRRGGRRPARRTSWCSSRTRTTGRSSRRCASPSTARPPSRCGCRSSASARPSRPSRWPSPPCASRCRTLRSFAFTPPPGLDRDRALARGPRRRAGCPPPLRRPPRPAPPRSPSRSRRCSAAAGRRSSS